MTVFKIAISVLAMVFLFAVVFLFISFRIADKRADKYDTVGTTLAWQKSKVPFLGRIIVEYTKKGRPYQTATGFMFKPKSFKIGVKSRWTILTYHSPGKPSFSKAKKYKIK
jgi:hypothetical protein